MTASVQAALLLLISLLAAATLACSSQETPTPTPDDAVPTQVFTQQDVDNAIRQTIEARDLKTVQAHEEIALQTRTAEATRTSVESLIEAAAGMTPVPHDQLTATPATPTAAQPATPTSAPEPAPEPQTAATPESPTPPPSPTETTPAPTSAPAPEPTPFPEPARTPVPTPTARPRPTPTNVIPPTPAPTPTPETAREPVPAATPGPEPTRTPWRTPPPPAAINPEDHPLAAGITESSPREWRTITALPWVRDGIAPEERIEFDLLLSIASEQPEDAAKLARMPFLKSIEPGDREALTGLNELAATAPGILKNIADAQKPYFRTTTDARTALPPSIAASLIVAPRIPPVIIPPIIHTETMELNGRQLRFDIVRDQAGLGLTMSLLQEAARKAEALMNRPLPATSVILFFRNPQSGYPEAFNTGMVIVAAPHLEQTLKRETGTMKGILLEQMMRYYWRNNAGWIDHGISRTAAIRDRAGPIVYDYPCHNAGTAADMDGRDPAWQPDDDYRCHATVGSRLFLELMNAAGKNAFRNAATGMYDLARTGVRLDSGYVRLYFGYYGDLALRIMQRGPTPDPESKERSTPDHRIKEIKGRVGESWLARDSCEKKLEEPLNPDGYQGTVLLCYKAAYDADAPSRSAGLTVKEYGPDGLAYASNKRQIITIPAFSEYIFSTPIGPGNGAKWKPGEHSIALLNDDGSLAYTRPIIVKR